MKNPLVAAFMILGLASACSDLPKIPITIPNPLAAQLNGDPAYKLRTQKTPPGYARLLNDTPHGFRYSFPDEPTRRGAVSERFELRNGDCQGADCENPRYRTEIRQEDSITKARISADNWYGWSFYNANVSSRPRNEALKTVFGQWKLDGDVPAAIRITQIGLGEGNWKTCDTSICNRSNDTTKDVVLQLDDMRRAMNWGAGQNEGYICKLFSLDQMKGKWVDLTLNTDFSSGKDGYLRAWVNGELVCDYRGRVSATTDRSGNANPNHRRGIFVSYTSRWDTVHGDTPKPTMIAYFDEFLSGQSREDVDTRIRESQGAAPKD